MAEAVRWRGMGRKRERKRELEIGTVAGENNDNNIISIL